MRRWPPATPTGTRHERRLLDPEPERRRTQHGVCAHRIRSNRSPKRSWPRGLASIRGPLTPSGYDRGQLDCAAATGMRCRPPVGENSDRQLEMRTPTRSDRDGGLGMTGTASSAACSYPDRAGQAGVGSNQAGARRGTPPAPRDRTARRDVHTAARGTRTSIIFTSTRQGSQRTGSRAPGRRGWRHELRKGLEVEADAGLARGSCVRGRAGTVVLPRGRPASDEQKEVRALLVSRARSSRRRGKATARRRALSLAPRRCRSWPTARSERRFVGVVLVDSNFTEHPSRALPTLALPALELRCSARYWSTSSVKSA